FNFLKYFSWQLFFLMLITGMSYFMKLPARIFNPLLVMLNLGNLIFIAAILKFKNTRLYYFILLPCLFIMIGIPDFVKSNNTFITFYKETGEVNKMMMD